MQRPGLLCSMLAVSAVLVLSGGAVAGGVGTAQTLGPDFNGDGFADLAIGVPGEAVGSRGGEGAVTVIYGSASRLSSANNQF